MTVCRRRYNVNIVVYLVGGCEYFQKQSVTLLLFGIWIIISVKRGLILVV